MRILHVSQPVTGGTSGVVLQLAAAGVRSGHQVSVASPADAQFETAVRACGARWIEVGLTRAAHLGDAAQVLRLRRLFGGYDLVQLHSSKAGAVGRFALATMRRRPRCVFMPHAWSWYVGGRAAPAYRLVERMLAAIADPTVVVSEQEERDGRAVLGRRAQLAVIPNGVDTDRYDRTDRTAGAANTIVFVGRLDRQKGVDRLIDAFGLLGRPSARLIVVGDGVDRAALHAQAAESDVAERIEFVEATDPRPYYRQADVVCVPSRWEGMSLVMLEAMASARAVVAVRCGGAEALDGGAGIVVEQADDAEVARELASAIACLLDHDCDRRAMAERARLRVLEEYSLAKTLRRHRQLWDRRPVRNV